MRVRDLGEWGLIELLAGIAREFGVAEREGLLLGMGDDAAAWHGEKGMVLATTDTLTQDVHFRLDTADLGDVGWKALAVNISDIAAMGGIPDYALVSLGLVEEMEVEDVARLYRGMTEAAHRYGVVIAGGNVSRSPLVSIIISLMGRVGGSGIMTRSSALPDDLIAVTGCLGSAAAGLRALAGGLELDEETAALVKGAHSHPLPRVEEGQMLARCGVRTAIDLSDGLISDLGQVCRASEVGARIYIDMLPVHPLVQAAFEGELPGLALSGGEDYELLFTAKSLVMRRVKGLLPLPVTVVGQVVEEGPGQVTLVDAEGRVLEWEESGWDHFGQGTDDGTPGVDNPQP